VSTIFLVARRDYFAYVGAWGFWATLLLGPLLVAALMFGPLVLARAEPPRPLAILADRAADAALVEGAFASEARDQARADLRAYLGATAPETISPALAAFDAAAERAAAINAARAVVAARAPRALRAFPALPPRYLIVAPPAPDIEGVKPYLAGQRTLPDGRALYGALYVRRADNTPAIEYWSANLSHQEPLVIARQAIELQMRREALAQHGVGAAEADRLEALRPITQQFDPRPSAGAGRITFRQRMPFYAALALAFVLWSAVFSTANMLLSSVLEEKSNKILDTLLTSVTPLQLLLGKLLAVAAVSATLFLFWGALGGALLNAAATRMSGAILGEIAAGFLDPNLIAAFAVGFAAGYIMYGAAFLALGALCESTQEAQTLLGPIALVLALPMTLLAPALDNPNAPIIESASWVPLFTPFLLLVRAPAGLSAVTIAGQGALMLASIAVVLWLASRVFHAGVVNEASLAGWRRKRRPA
jgi:ABC-2 type transport system permease protein